MANKPKTRGVTFPDPLLIYVCDYCEGKPLFAVAETVDEIPDDVAGHNVATYEYRYEHVFKIEKVLQRKLV